MCSYLHNLLILFVSTANCQCNLSQLLSVQIYCVPLFSVFSRLIWTGAEGYAIYQIATAFNVGYMGSTNEGRILAAVFENYKSNATETSPCRTVLQNLSFHFKNIVSSSYSCKENLLDIN